MQLMGRTVDLHYLVSQRINSTLLRSLEVAISRFEALGFTAVVVSIVMFVILRVFSIALSIIPYTGMP